MYAHYERCALVVATIYSLLKTQARTSSMAGKQAEATTVVSICLWGQVEFLKRENVTVKKLFINILKIERKGCQSCISKNYINFLYFIIFKKVCSCHEPTNS